MAILIILLCVQLTEWSSDTWFINNWLFRPCLFIYLGLSPALCHSIWVLHLLLLLLHSVFCAPNSAFSSYSVWRAHVVHTAQATDRRWMSADSIVAQLPWHFGRVWCKSVEHSSPPRRFIWCVGAGSTIYTARQRPFLDWWSEMQLNAFFANGARKRNDVQQSHSKWLEWKYIEKTDLSPTHIHTHEEYYILDCIYTCTEWCPWWSTVTWVERVQRATVKQTIEVWQTTRKQKQFGSNYKLGSCQR